MECCQHLNLDRPTNVGSNEVKQGPKLVCAWSLAFGRSGGHMGEIDSVPIFSNRKKGPNENEINTLTNPHMNKLGLEITCLIKRHRIGILTHVSEFDICQKISDQSLVSEQSSMTAR